MSAEKRPLWPWMVATVIALAPLQFAILGFCGTLSDTSAQENIEQGLTFLAIAAIPFAPVILWLLWTNRSSPD